MLPKFICFNDVSLKLIDEQIFLSDMCWLSLDFLYGPIPILIKGKGVGDTLETFGHKTYLHVGKKIKITFYS